MQRLYLSMTAWQTLRTNLNMCFSDFLYKIRKALLTPTDISILRQFIRKAGYLYPSEYIKVHIHSDYIQFSHIKNKQIIEQSILQSDQYEPSFNCTESTFLNTRTNLPLHILIYSESIDYRIFSLRHAKWWDRYGIFNQIKKTEFSDPNWLYTAHVPTKEDEQRYVFAHLQPCPRLHRNLTFIQSHINSIIKIQITSVQQTMTAIDHVYMTEPNHTFCPWVIFIQKTTSTEWLLTAQHYGAIILSRRGFFSSSEIREYPNEASIFNEITTTLRYLQRHNYKENEAFTLITTGFSEVLSPNHITGDMQQRLPIADIHTIPARDIDKRILLPEESIARWVITLIKSFFKVGIPHYYRKSLKPQMFAPHQNAYWIPFISLRILYTATFVCSLTTFWWAFQAINITHDTLTIEQEKSILSRTTNDPIHMRKATFFQHYQNLKGLNPLDFIKKLPMILGKDTQISQFMWSSYHKDNQWHPKFQATLSLPAHLFNEKRKTLNPKSYKKYKQRISTNLTSAINASITWTPTAHKNVYTIGVSWKQ